MLDAHARVSPSQGCKSNGRNPVLHVTLEEYGGLDGLGLAAAVREGRTTAAELARLALEAIELLDPRLNAVAETYAEAGTGLAAPAGAFAGVPFLFKDAGAAQAGRRQEMGSRLLAGRVVRESSFLADRFGAAGLVAVGRSNVPEFTLSLSTESALHGPTRNPWDTGLLAGGSSGGAAAAVAAGIVPLAHATDTAGSIRIPASACGIVGLKPSRGRVTHGPGAGEPFMGLDAEFAVTRSVRDTAALLDAVSGPAAGDPCPLPPPPRPYLDELGAPLERLRIAVATEAWGGYATDPEIVRGVVQLASDLEGEGHVVEEAKPRLEYERFIAASMTAWALGFDLTLEAFAREMDRPLDATTLEPVTLRLLEHARRVGAHDVVRAEATFNEIRREFGRFFESYDLLLTPTLLRKPEPLGRYSQRLDLASFEEFFRLCDESGAFLPPFNLTGQPAISLPLLWSDEGLPLGVQFVARLGEESLLLRLAAMLEGARPWNQRRPPLHVGHDGQRPEEGNR